MEDIVALLKGGKKIITNGKNVGFLTFAVCFDKDLKKFIKKAQYRSSHLLAVSFLSHLISDVFKGCPYLLSAA